MSTTISETILQPTTTIDSDTVNMSESPFRKHLPDLSIPRFTAMRNQNARDYAASFKSGAIPPWLHALYMFWLELLQEPFKGVTSDGSVRPGLFQVQDEGVPIEAIVDATQAVLSHVTPEQSSKLLYHIDSPEWRTWSNPEFLLSDKGLRLDEINPDLRASILNVLKQTLSTEGYAKAISAMRINHFLGELVQSPGIMNEFSYNFVLFGRPSTSKPWGFSFYGHHLCLNVFLYRTQIVISPWFTGAEPNYIDSGPYKGTRILHEEERLGLEVMQSLTPSQQTTAQIYKSMHDPSMPEGRWNHDDQRHLCGAYRDNRIVPYEGILVSSLSPSIQSQITAILTQYLLYLPPKARALRLSQAQSYYPETYFSWIGGFTDSDPFYFRIQSPVIIVEFDHHSGVFLNNDQPAKFHIHTLLRTPNGGDYGYALRPLIHGREQEFVWKP